MSSPFAREARLASEPRMPCLVAASPTRSTDPDDSSPVAELVRAPKDRPCLRFGSVECPKARVCIRIYADRHHENVWLQWQPSRMRMHTSQRRDEAAMDAAAQKYGWAPTRTGSLRGPSPRSTRLAQTSARTVAGRTRGHGDLSSFRVRRSEALSSCVWRPRRPAVATPHAPVRMCTHSVSQRHARGAHLRTAVLQRGTRKEICAPDMRRRRPCRARDAGHEDAELLGERRHPVAVERAPPRHRRRSRFRAQSSRQICERATSRRALRARCPAALPATSRSLSCRCRSTAGSSLRRARGRAR
jgi:hypothetical protein